MDPSSDAILPRGALGELCFGGEQVFRGYLNRPDLNGTKLLNLAHYGRVYRSGDMGRLLSNDCILSAGRSDDQVKIRGQRVELGEITSLILDDLEVHDCATLLSLNKQGIQTLVNFWTPKNCSRGGFTVLDFKALRSTILRLFETLSQRLPTYMLPSYVIPVSRIPMTAQAKIDKRLLQATFVSLPDIALTLSSPAHATDSKSNGVGSDAEIPLLEWERSFAEILARVLQVNVENIQKSTSFFHLGLDSVSAIRLCNTLRQSKLGDFTVAEVLRNPTISYLDAIRMHHGASTETPKKSLKTLQNIFTGDQRSLIHSAYHDLGLQVEKINPCTPLQEAMLASGAASGAKYSNTMVFNVKGDVAWLKACWELAQSRHEILRTSFISSERSDYTFAQVVLKKNDLSWGQVNTLHNLQSDMGKVLADLLSSHRPPLHLGVYEVGTITKMIFSCHHALYDGIAITVLLEEIQSAYYNCILPPTASYDRYLQHMISRDPAEADEFWSSRFANFEPTYFPDLTGKVHKHPGVPKSLRRDLQVPLSAVREASQRASVSILSMIQAAWVKLLHFYTGEHDLCFGNVISGRALPEDDLDRLVAPCFNTLPIRINFDFSKSNSALIHSIHTFNVDSLAHQLTALRRIQNAALTEGGRLFDSLVILQQPSKPLDDTIWTLEEDMGEMDVPLVCEVYQDDRSDVLRLTLHYNTELLSEADARIAVETFDTNLSVLIHHAEAAANDSVGFSSALLAESNMGCKQLPSDFDLLHQGFERNVLSLQPDAIGLDFLHADGRKTIWTYTKLNLIANHIACRLMQHSVGVEDIVPINMAKSPMFYAAILGVLKAGAAFAPVHPDLPEARKELMFRELNAKVILCTEDPSRSAEQSPAAILDISDLQTGRLDACATPLISNLTGASLAYCLYTSGSTGVPKAVSMEHRSPIQTIESSKSLVPWNSSSRLLQYAAITFDMCYYDCFLAWTLGITVCAAEQHIMFDNLAHVIESLDVTLLDLTPSVAATLPRVQVPTVQWMYCIGEAMSADVAMEWNGACVNSYGPTEAAFCTTMFPVSEDVKTSVIGQPYPTTSFAVFSPKGEVPLPTLSVGELYIGGTQLARGYLGRIELTDERFVTRCGQRLYKSGDTVRMLSNGHFEFIGRVDDQVKIRGQRVELGEISHALQDCDSCIKSVTTQILKMDAAAKEQLVSFLATGGKLNDSDQDNLRRKAILTAKSRLPAYMVPQFVVIIDSIPKSMAGKLDKKALQLIFQATITTTGSTNGFRDNHKWNGVELDVRNILGRLSKTPVNDILPGTSIYQLGLDSISAVQIAAALRKRGYNASASDVMRFTNCVDLAQRLVESVLTSTCHVNRFDFEAFDAAHRAAILKDCGLDDQYVEAIRPCTPLQQGMVSQFIAKDGAVYYNCLRLHMRNSDTNLAKLKHAWTVTMMRHPVLRTGFAQIKDKQSNFAMVQFKPDSVSLPWSEASSSDAELATERLRTLQYKALTQLHQPMWDIQLNVVGQEIFLELSIFHALFDAHSLRLIFNDVAAIYNGGSPGEAPPLDQVLSELLHLNKGEHNQAENFWMDLGKRTVVSRFPNMAPLRYEPKAPVVLMKSSSMSIAEIEDGCRAADTTLQAVGIASWSSILSAYTGEPSVTIGVVLSGRTSEVTDSAVFPCINTVPFPCTITADKAATLNSIMTLNAELHQYQFTPLNRVQKLMGLSNDSVFDSLFAFQKTTGGSQQNELWTILDEIATTEYPVSIELELKQTVLEYRITYLPHVIPSQQAEMILDQLDFVARTLILPKSVSVTESLLDHSLYSITPAKESTLPSEARLLHEFVELTANMYPDRIAFEFASSIHDGEVTSKKWSYRQLDAEGNRIAHMLMSHDILPGELIGVCFDKCPEASFAMLGILKSGCSFVAIDPSAPSARQAFIVEDSRSQMVLSVSTQSASFKEHVKVPILDLDRISTHDFAPSRPQLRRGIQPQDRSYCLYTSGTTGTPKGCELTHENAVQAMLAFQRLFAGHWDDTSRWLQFASFHFDVSILEQYWSWSVGICVVSAPRDLIFEDIASSIRTLSITHIDLTPSLAQILHPDEVPSLCKGVFITGGESLKQEILDVWGPKSVIYNGYGPTEATIGCTMYPRVPANGKPSNIGSQFDNVGSYVLKPDSEVPVLRGGVGELCVSGKLVGKGYLNRPKLTEERFAYLDRFGERVYRTGDLVRILHNGTFDFLGRADDQVKLRGQRLEIGEINSVIRQSSKDFTDVATLVLRHPKQQKEQLVAFIVIGIKSPREPAVLLVEAGRLTIAKETCHDRLPPYMVPTHYVPLAAMPLNINNKADGKKLRQIYEALSSSDLLQLSATPKGSDYACSKQEEKLRHVLAESLSIARDAVGRSSSFYELGMDSISVIGVSRALKQAGFQQATPAILMQYSTISRLSKVLSMPSSVPDTCGSLHTAQQAIKAIQHRYRRTVAQTLDLDSRDIVELAPCTPLQQGMIARYLDSDYGLYFNTFQFQLSWDIEISRLRSAYESVFENVQILRTAFASTDDGYVQAILQGIPLPWSEHDIEHGSVPKYLQKLRRIWLLANKPELKRPFEIHLVGRPGAQLLVVHIFHGLYDGHSIELLFEEVLNRFGGSEPDAVNIPTFHEALAHGPLRNVEGARKFWEGHLTNLTPMSLPSLTEKPANSTIVVTRNLDPIPVYETIRRKLNVTAQAIAQASWVHALQNYAHASITIGMVISGRSLDLENADHIIGPMFNTVPYQQHIRDGDTWASLITKAHEFNTASLPYVHTPLRDIQRWCKRTCSQPLFESLFVFQGVHPTKDQWRSNAAWELLDDNSVPDYPLAFEIEQKNDDGFRLTLVTQGHISCEKASNELLDRFVEALTNALTEPSTVVERSICSTGSSLNGATEKEQNANGLNSTTKFDWTRSALAIKEEIANLAGANRSDIDKSTSILELGLDSIDAIKLSSRLKRRSVNIPVSGIMRGLTIENMAKTISNGQIETTQSEVDKDFASRKRELRRIIDQHGIDLTEVHDVLPLTPLQEAMVAEMIASDYTRYYNFDVAQLATGTDIDRLMQAWQTVMESSPILRTSFIEVDDPKIDGPYAQIVIKQRPSELWMEKQELGSAEKPDFSAIMAKLRYVAARSKALDPPVRIIFLETPVTTYQILSIAHALYDGWSLGLLHDAVNAAYHGRHAPHPSYEATLADILSASGPAAADFWQSYLIEMKPSLFPRRPMGVMGTVHHEERTSDVRLTDIMDFAKNSRVSLQTLGQTIFALSLASYVGSLDVTFGSVLSGRDDDGRSQLLFPTMNTVAIRAVLHGSRRELLQYMQNNFNNIRQWQHFPLRKARNLAGVQGKLFDSLFIYQKGLEQSSSTDMKLYDSIEGQSDVEYSVCAEMEVVNEQLVWRCAVKDEVLSLQGSQMLLRRLDEVLRRIIEHPDSPSINSTSQENSVCGLPAFRGPGIHSPEDEYSHNKLNPSLDAPLSETASKIRQVLAMVSQVPEQDIKRGMSIFHIGLDSISAIKVSSILRKQCITLSVGDMLKAGTVEKMATVVAASLPSQDTSPTTIGEDVLRGIDQERLSSLADVELSHVDRILPVTAGQIYMISMWLNTNGASLYPEFYYHLEGSLSLWKLRESWQALAATNAILRTQIIATGQSDIPYVQLVLKQTSASLTDITGQDEEQAITTTIRTAMQQPWVHLFVSLTSKGWKLKLKIHHALYDGVSLPLLMEQFQDLCNGITLSASTHSLDNYIAAAHAPSLMLSRKAFWMKYLESVEMQPCKGPNAALRSRIEIFESEFIHTSTLEAIARRRGVSTQALFLAAYAKVHASRTGVTDGKDIVLGIYLANRSLPIDNLPTAPIPTVNLLPLRVRSPISTAILDAATEIQYNLQEISGLANATASLHEISEWTGVKVDTFVNFLSLPVTDHNESSKCEGAIVEIKQKEGWQESVSRVAELDITDWEAPKAMIDERINAAYLVSPNILRPRARRQIADS